MRLFLFRHGPAEQLSSDDFSRALSRRGQRLTRRAARGFSHWITEKPPIFFSPKIRALQTAEILCEFFKDAPATLWPELESSTRWATLQPRLRALEEQTAILVGHEPHLSELASEILTGHPGTLSVELKKAGVCVLEIDWEKGSAKLQAVFPPRALRQLAPG